MFPLVAMTVLMPSDSVVPTGMSLTSTTNVSLASATEALIVNAALCVSSSTVTVDGTINVGASATAETTTAIESDLLA